jgi:hypothetical protein
MVLHPKKLSRKGHLMPQVDSGKKIIVLTPVRNEAWRMRTFLESCLAWADHVILSDQMSTDDTAKIASTFDRVTILKNTSKDFNELENRKNLLSECRNRFGHAIVFSLDADEFVSSEIFTPSLQSKLHSLPEGTGIAIPHANLHNGGFWRVRLDPIAFVDDGRSTSISKDIHFPRTCFSDFPEGIVALPLLLFHLQYMDQSRYRSKIDWYQLLEVTEFGRSDFIGLFRQYHHFDAVGPRAIEPLSEKFLDGYRSRGIDPLDFEIDSHPWWASDSISMFQKLTERQKNRLILSSSHFSTGSKNRIDRIIRFYLSCTQRFYRPSKINPVFLAIYLIDFVLKQVWKLTGRSN